MRNPTIKLIKFETLPGTDTRCVELRLEGGDLANGWAPKPGETAWCNVTCYMESGGRAGVGVWGGAVWPGAWPHLFDVRSHSNGTHIVTLMTPALIALVEPLLDESV